MAYEIPGFSFTLPSAANYKDGSAKFRFVNVNATGKAVLAAAGGDAIGVCQISPDLNEAMTIVCSGVSFLVAGGAIAPGDYVSADATGRAVVAGAGTRRLGRALETASGAGIQIAVLLVPLTATA